MTAMTTILALDSSSENCSVAVYHDYVMNLCSEYAPRKHTQLILPLAKKALAQSELDMDDVRAIAFGAGPGSFTGIRIAAGVAQGLAFGLNVPIYAVSNLEGLALQSFLENGISTVLACIDARMGEVYWGVFEISESDVSFKEKVSKRYAVKTLVVEQVTSPEQVTLPEQFRGRAKIENHSIAAMGSGVSLLPSQLQEAFSHSNSEAQPNADALALLATSMIFQGLAGELKEALPRYVRDTVTWNKLPGRE